MNASITSALTILTPAFLFTSIASGGISNMYITTNHGAIFEVNGNTLQATQVAQLDDANTINDILYVGNGRFVANLTFAMASFDLNTQTQETLFTAQDAYGVPGFFTLTSGLARRANGDVFFSVNQIGTPQDTEIYGVSYDTQSNTSTRIADVPGGTNVDFYELANGTMIAANVSSQIVSLFDPEEGDVFATYTIDIPAVSFVQSFNELYMLTREGDLYTFDITDGSTDYYGSITGVNAPFIGASIASTAALIPAPSAMLTMVGGLAIGFRRRR